MGAPPRITTENERASPLEEVWRILRTSAAQGSEQPINRLFSILPCNLPLVWVRPTNSKQRTQAVFGP